MRIVSGSLDRTIKVHSTSTKKQHILLYIPKKVWGDKTSAYIHEKVWGVSNLDCLVDKKATYCIVYS